MRLSFTWPILIILGMCCAGCGQQEPQTLAAWPLDDLSGLMDQDPELTIDTVDALEGEGCLYIDAEKRRTVKLFKLDDLAIENAKLTFSIQLKCMSLSGHVFPELWCWLADGSEITKRGHETGIARSRPWTDTEVSVILEKGSQIVGVRAQLVLEGGGHVWADNAKMIVGPIPVDQE